VANTDSTTDTRSTTTNNLIRLSVNMNAETAAALKEYAASTKLSYTEAVRRAIAIAKYINDEKLEGRKIQTTDPERNEIRELILM
jgi:hypothetical protein